MNKCNSKPTITVGGTSLIMIFAVLVLTIFSVLSLVSANSDYNLTKKTSESITRYYDADTNAVKKLKEIDEVLINAYKESATEKQFYNYISKNIGDIFDINTNQVYYEIPISNEQFLCVRLKVLYSENRFEILSWKSENRMEYTENESINIWDGESEVD